MPLLWTAWSYISRDGEAQKCNAKFYGNLIVEKENNMKGLS